MCGAVLTPSIGPPSGGQPKLSLFQSCFLMLCLKNELIRNIYVVCSLKLGFVFYLKYLFFYFIPVNTCLNVFYNEFYFK